MTKADDLDTRIQDVQRRIAARLGRPLQAPPSRLRSPEIEAFDEFIKNICVADGLRREDAQRNVSESLVELTYYNQHTGNGLLITDDGYFLTALHCVKKDNRYPLDQARIRLYDGTIYPVEKVCARAKSEDLAIVKAAIPKVCTPRQYKFYNTNVLDNDPVVLLSRWDGVLVVKDGSITHANYRITTHISDKPDVLYRNHFLTDHAAIRGDSGGTITTPDGRVVGIVSGGKHLVTSCAKIIRVLDLIDSYKRHIQKHLK